MFAQYFGRQSRRVKELLIKLALGRLSTLAEKYKQRLSR